MKFRLGPTVASALLLGELSPLRATPVEMQFHGGPTHLGVFEAPSPGNLLRTVWTFDAGNVVISSPVVAGRSVYVGTKGGRMLALDKLSGSLQWQFSADGPITATVAVANGWLFFQSTANTVYALDATTGRLLWQQATGPTVRFSSIPSLESAHLPEGTNFDYWTSSPLYADGVVYIGSGDSNIYALRAGDGHIVWKFKTGNRVRATPATDGDRIYVGGFDGVMYALDRATGKAIWSFKTKGNSYFPVGSIQSAAAIAGDLVLFGSRDYRLYALDARTGKEVWENLHKDSWVPATPAVKDERVYTPSSDGHFIRCTDLKTGTEIWTAPTDFAVFSAPAVSSESLYAGTLGGMIVRVRLADGKTSGITLEAPILTAPWIDSGVIYFATNDGIIYALADGIPPKRSH
ncbi:MAG: PQQ-binding-like beta-propeller repeat protein [Gammaproteobacteria bacterium]|nr:PQQ-binding-like beta-propeller repeat protein [Gammaproteobacteria bacterium]